MPLTPEDVEAPEVLAGLNNSGVLSDDEFSELKDRILSGRPTDHLTLWDVRGLEALAGFNVSGVLSDDEFSELKDRILRGEPADHLALWDDEIPEWLKALKKKWPIALKKTGTLPETEFKQQKGEVLHSSAEPEILATKAGVPR